MMTAASRATRLFTLRLWQEDVAEGRIEWRGKVQALPDGEAYYFRGWPGLIGRLEALLGSGTNISPDDIQEVHMFNENATWEDALLRLLALAARLEDEGQYNIAKLLRAAADAITRRGAYRLAASANSAALAGDVALAAGVLANFDVDQGLAAALRRGAAALAEGRIPLIGETPHPYVCRTCGHVTLGEPAGRCPTCGAWPAAYQRFMPNYWLDALEPFAALDALRRTPEEVTALLAGLPEEAMSRPPDDGGWAIRNIVTHLRDAQRVLDYRLDLFLAEEHPLLEMKAVWTWAAHEEAHPPATRAIFAGYHASRAETLRKLEALPLAGWWRTGEHQEFGAVTLRQQVSYFASHEITHLPQIARLRPQ